MAVNVPLTEVYLKAVSTLQAPSINNTRLQVDKDRNTWQDNAVTTKVHVIEYDRIISNPLEEGVLRVKPATEFVATDVRALSTTELQPLLKGLLEELFIYELLKPEQIRVTSAPTTTPADGRIDYYLEVTLVEDQGYKAIWAIRLTDQLMSDSFNMRRVNSCIDILIAAFQNLVTLQTYSWLTRDLAMLLFAHITKGYPGHFSQRLAFPGGNIKVIFSNQIVAYFELTIGVSRRPFTEREMNKALQLKF